MTRTILPLFCALLALPALHAQQVYPFAHHSKWGVVDEKGKVTMRPALDTIGFFTPYGSTLHQPLAVANKGGKAGLITPAGAWLLKPVAEQISYDLIQKQPLRWATVGGKFGFLGDTGSFVTEPIYDSISWIKHPNSQYTPIALLHLGDRVGAANSDGRQILSAAFTKINTWNDWLIVHTPNGYQGLAKPSGEVYLPAGWKE